jgi:transketolase
VSKAWQALTEHWPEYLEEYRDAVLRPDCGKRLAIESGSPFGWERYAGAEE